MRDSEITQLIQQKKFDKHSINIENREKATISGVLDVGNFNENEITLRSQGGTLTLFGEALHIKTLNLETGTLIVDGFIGGVEYHIEKKQGPLFNKIFK